jgi:hypothetical protein
MSNRVSNGAVFALALILIVGGAWGIWRGSDYIQLERGWASVISGSVAATGGVLALAIGFVLRRLDALHKALRAVGAVSTDMERPLEAPVAAPPVEPMPLGLAPAPVAHEPVVYEPEPQPTAAYTDPALQAAAAVNMELLEREERPAFGAEPHPSVSPPRETISTEAPPEMIHAAHQGPADDMAKAAGVSDEPELDAAIEELLAEERGRGSHDDSAEQVPPPVSADASAETPIPSLTVTPEVSEKAPQRSGWRGLFSRKERRARTPPAESAAEPLSPGAADASIAPEREARPHVASTEEPAAAEPDTIPRTGDDWFDRALSGLDEVDRPYRAGEVSEHTRQATEHFADKQQVHPPSLQEPPGVPAEPAVIGRYTSGNTTYIMFADGSIEAETPTGILRFASLAELKSYVEGGQ